MKASELRIGNYVMAINNYEDIFYVNCIYGHRDLNITAGMYINYDTSIRNIKPIRITDEWLLSFDFEIIEQYNNGVLTIKRYGKSIINGDTNSNEKLVITFPFNYCEIGDCNEDYNYTLNRCIDYVHSLQNLYFALTGEELTIKK